MPQGQHIMLTGITPFSRDLPLFRVIYSKVFFLCENILKQVHFRAILFESGNEQIKLYSI